VKIDSQSLAQTVDSVNEAYFMGDRVTAKESEEIALWIAARQGLEGAYARMFAPTPYDLKHGIRVFTGEAIVPSASLRHVSGEEACRAILLLKPRSKQVQAALERATEGMMAALERAGRIRKDFFCCGRCDPALWRHISAGGLKGSDEWIAKGMKTLKAHRDGSGKWRRFPFFYTLLALTEIDLPSAIQEIKYVAPVCERYVKRGRPSNRLMQRRRIVAERILAKI
jgi:hypothetical protein